MAFRYDSIKLPALRDTAWGAKVADARVARTGVLSYTLPDGTVRRELRLPEEVFSKDSMATLRGVPVTIKHPGMLSPSNVRAHRVGGQIGEPKQDGDYLATELQIEEKTALDGVEKKELQEISCGYLCAVEMTPGTWRGQKYDGIQRKIRHNHIAIGPVGWGRSGPEVSLRLDGGDGALEEVAFSVFDDSKIVCDIPHSDENPDVSGDLVSMKIQGVELKLDARDEAVISAHLDAQAKLIAERDAKIVSLEAAAGKAAGEAAALKTRMDAAEAEVSKTARVALEVSAQAVLGAAEKFDGKSDADVRTAVIAKVFPSLKLDGKSGDYIAATFDVALATHKDAKPPVIAAAKPPVKTTPVVAKLDENGAPAKSPREQMIENRRTAAAFKTDKVK